MNSIDNFIEIFEIDTDKFADWCITSAKWIPTEKAESLWKRHLEKISNQTNAVYVRRYGRNNRNHEMQKFIYQEIGIKIEFDPTNNAGPAKIIYEGTGLKKNVHIYNYKISHIFGLTKNPYSFMAPWNMLYTSILTDPFTGHESNHDLTSIITTKIQDEAKSRYYNLIKEYNEIIKEKYNELKDRLEINDEIDVKLSDALLNDFSTICL